MSKIIRTAGANKARLDNRWGCSVAMRSITLTRHPKESTPASGILVRNVSTLEFTH